MMKGPTSKSAIWPRTLVTTGVIMWTTLSAYLLVLESVVADGPAKGIGNQFTVFGERCAGESCRFDETEVGGDVARFCLTNATGGGRPVQLVKPAANHLGLELVDEGLELLRTLTKPLAVVAVIGGIKTGKSFLLNVLNEHVVCGDGDSLDGFHVDDTVAPTTRGIWLWSKPIEVKCKDLESQVDGKPTEQGFFEQLGTMVDTLLGGTMKATVTTKKRIDVLDCQVETVNVLLLDVEGFNSTDGFQLYDEALFTIASTLSTELIYLTHRVIDARDIMQLQHMLQVANSTLVNIHRSLSKSPRVEVKEDSGENDGISVTQQAEPTEDGESVIPVANNLSSRDVFLEVQRNTNLTISVQGFSLKLQKSALDYINDAVNGRRFDLSYKDRKSFFEYVGKLRNQFLNFLRDEPQGGSPEQVVNDWLSKITSGYKYVIPHVFGSIDVLLTSSPSKENRTTLLKESLARGYLEQIRKFKARVFKRSLIQPKKRYSQVLDSMTLTTGDDLGDLLAHLVNSLNKSMKSGSMDHLDDIRVTRANTVKRDLVDLYAGDLSEFIKKQPIPLQDELETFNGITETKYVQLLSVYGQHDLSSEQFVNLKVDFDKLMHKTLDHYRQKLNEITRAYCRSKVPSVKSSIRERIEQFQLPSLPSVLKQFEGKKDELLELYATAVDENAIKYSRSVACKDVWQEVLNFINEVVEELYKDNENEISMLFQEASRRAVESFISNADRNSVEKYRVNHKEFLETLNSWVSGAYSAYYKEIGDFRNLEKFNEGALSFLAKQISLFEKEARDHWHDVCKDAITHISHKFKTTFDAQLMKLVPYRPAPTAVLSLAIEYLRACGWHKMEQLYCSPAQQVRDAQLNFNRMVDETRDKAMADNYEDIFKHLNKEFKVLQDQALDRVENMYIFYQLKRHIHWYAEWHVFQKMAVFEALLKPKRNLEELTKNVDFDLLKELTDNRMSQNLLALQQSGASTTIKMAGVDLRGIREDLVEQWLNVKLYPTVRPHLMLRMPAMSTFLAVAGGIVSSLLILNVQESRVLYFLYCLNVASMVHIMGPRRAWSLLDMTGRGTWRLLVMGATLVGPIWTYAICSTIVVIGLLRFLWIYRHSWTILSPKRFKSKGVDGVQ